MCQISRSGLDAANIDESLYYRFNQRMNTKMRRGKNAFSYTKKYRGSNETRIVNGNSARRMAPTLFPF